MRECSKEQIEMIKNAFPLLETQLIEWPEDFLPKKIAISIFDRWLGIDNLDKLERVEASEVLIQEANDRHVNLIGSIKDDFNIFTFEQISTNKIVFYQFENRNEIKSHCQYKESKSGNDFFFLIIPEIQALYYENWDFTNVLWFKCEKSISDIEERVRKSKLNIIHY